MTRLSIFLLGPFLVTLGGEAATGFEYDKVRALLAYLSAEADRPHRREVLAGLLWPEQPEQTARNNLRQALSKLRKAIGDRKADPPFLYISREAIQFNRNSDFELDMDAFSSLLAKRDTHAHRRLETCSKCAQWQEEAIKHYRNDFLDGFSLSGSAAFEEWVVVRREAFHRLALKALNSLAAYHELRGNYARAYEYAARQIALEPWREEGHRQAMRALAFDGQRSAALAQYEQCRDALAENLDVLLSPETTYLYERIRGNTLGDAPADRRLTGAIPEPTSPLIGRQAELTQLIETLSDPDCRLLSIIGPGGIGKTRLTQTVALALEADFPHGAAFVLLAAIASANGLAAAAADTLRLRFEGVRTEKDQLLDYLENKELLLVLDNYEHLLPDVALLADILSRAPGLTILVTSRQRLGLAAEWVYDLSGLEYPVEPFTEALESFSAAQLFHQRALQVKKNFLFSDGDAPAVTRICGLAEGMPLAIELAASSVRYYSCEQIADQLETDTRTLSTTLGDVPERHHSLYAAFEHSWNLLKSKEQRIFSVLSVFRGGFDAETAAKVTGASAMLLRNLADKSLLQRVGGGRFDMHPLLRQYAGSKLQQSGEESAMLRKHLLTFAELAEQGEVALRGGDQLAWLARLESEQSNMLAAIEWGLDTDLETAARLANANWLFWFMHGHFFVGRRLYESLLAAGDALSPYQRGRALTGRASAAMAQHDVDRLESTSEEGLRLFQALDDPEGISLSLHHLGNAAGMRGDSEQALLLLEKGLSHAWKIEDSWFAALLQSDRARYLAERGEYEQARIAWAETLTHHEERGNEWAAMYIRNNLAAFARKQGEYDRARPLFEESLSLAHHFGDQRVVAWTLCELAEIALAESELAKAASLYEQSGSFSKEVGSKDGLALANLGLGDVAVRRGYFKQAMSYYEQGAKFYLGVRHVLGMASSLERMAELSWLRKPAGDSVRWLATATALRENKHMARPPTESNRYERLKVSMRDQLGEAIFAKLWAEGQSLLVEEVLIELLANVELNSV